MRSLETVVRDHIKLYAAPECMTLCNLVQEKLPRELRDYIYEFMLSDRACSITDSPAVPDNANVVDLRLEHLCKVQHVGSQTLQEIVETWYRITTFDFLGADSQNPHIPAFFARDRCGFNLDVCKLVKNVTLYVMYELPEGNIIESLVADTKELLVIKSKAHITIFLEHQVACPSWVESANCLPILFPVLQQLIRAGHHVKMDIHNGAYVF